jgi:hypothetical protein
MTPIQFISLQGMIEKGRLEMGTNVALKNRSASVFPSMSEKELINSMTIKLNSLKKILSRTEINEDTYLTCLISFIDSVGVLKSSKEILKQFFNYSTISNKIYQNWLLKIELEKEEEKKLQDVN